MQIVQSTSDLRIYENGDETLLDRVNKGNLIVKNYTLNHKKALEKIAENTKIPNLNQNYQNTCICIQMSSGAYQLAAMEFIRKVKENDVIEINGTRATCSKSEPRYDINKSLIESLLTFLVDLKTDQKVTLHFYHTVQKILVQGTARWTFTEKILYPHLNKVTNE